MAKMRLSIVNSIGYRRNILIALIALIVALVGIPFLWSAGNRNPFCPLSVSAQDNPCLAQEVTISAQELQILGLQATSNAQGLQIFALQETNEALRQANLNQPLIVITVPIVITATQAPAFTVSVTPEKSSSSETPVGDMTNQPMSIMPSTSTSSHVQIVEVDGAGNFRAEGVVIRNTGSTVNLKDWTLISNNGDTYTFGEQFLFANAVITVFSGKGENTSISLYWNRNKPILVNPGDFIVLKDNRGRVQSVYQLP